MAESSSCASACQSSKDLNIKRRQEKKDKRIAKLKNTKQISTSQKSSLKNLNEDLYPKHIEVGQKKDITIPLPDSYSTKFVECFWYEWWLSQGFFKPEYLSPMIDQENCHNNVHRNNKNDDNNNKYTILLPPPNITGKLHLGHGLTISIEDALVRFHRMNGFKTLFIPGTDHAGIATQIVVEKRLKKLENKTRTEYSRSEFFDKVLQWKDQYEESIFMQIKSLGSSVDWSRKYFTMDKQIKSSVTRAFCELHDRGLIYRQNKLVNWSCILQSAISKVEVENLVINGSTHLHVPGYDKTIEFGILHEFAYELSDDDSHNKYSDNNDSKKTIIIATTRIETMLGDVAIAVNPFDDRYKHLIGRFVKHPFCDRFLPIIGDEYVSVDFGTGAVKITPGHDYNDYEIALRHNLHTINIFNDDGTISTGFGEFSGLKRFDARYAIIKKLKSLDLYLGKKSHAQSLPMCSRSKDIIEPILKYQWFLKCKDVALRADKCLKDGHFDIKPDNFKKIWSNWMVNCEDWCISRQLWWGIQIPAFCVTNPKTNQHTWVSAPNDQIALQKAIKICPKDFDANCSVIQDQDVLDTWFSSALLPFAALGWSQSQDFIDFFPNQILETGSDILFFWVARMVFMSLMLCNKVPFKQVYLHSMVRDAFGRKMSKSLGNVIDPFMVINGVTLDEMHQSLLNGNLDSKEIEKAKQGQKATYPNGIPVCGSDALRFSLIDLNTSPKDLNLNVDEIICNRKFCNKIWNAYKFMMHHFGEDFRPVSNICEINNLDSIDIYILSNLHDTIVKIHQYFISYQLNEVTSLLYDFFINKFCDVYVECSKLVLNLSYQSNDLQEDTQKEIFIRKQVLFCCMRTFLLLLHPIMPFITEELFQRFPRLEEHSKIIDDNYSICISQYPKIDYLSRVYDETLCLDFEKNFLIIKSIRNLRSVLNIRKEITDVMILLKYNDESTDKHRIFSSFDKFSQYINYLSKSNVSIIEADSGSNSCIVSKEFSNYIINLKLPDMFDSEEFCKKTENQIKKLLTSKNKLLQQNNKNMEFNSQNKLSNTKQHILDEKKIKIDDEIKSLQSLVACIQL